MWTCSFFSTICWIAMNFLNLLKWPCGVFPLKWFIKFTDDCVLKHPYILKLNSPWSWVFPALCSVSVSSRCSWSSQVQPNWPHISNNREQNEQFPGVVHFSISEGSFQLRLLMKPRPNSAPRLILTQAVCTHCPHLSPFDQIGKTWK